MKKFTVFVNGSPQTQYASNIRVAANNAVAQAARWVTFSQVSLTVSATQDDKLNYQRFQLVPFRPATQVEAEARKARGYVTYKDADLDGCPMVAVADRKVMLLPKASIEDAARAMLHMEPEADVVIVRNDHSYRIAGIFRRE